MSAVRREVERARLRGRYLLLLMAGMFAGLMTIGIITADALYPRKGTEHDWKSLTPGLGGITSISADSTPSLASGINYAPSVHRDGDHCYSLNMQYLPACAGLGCNRVEVACPLEIP